MWINVNIFKHIPGIAAVCFVFIYGIEMCQINWLFNWIKNFNYAMELELILFLIPVTLDPEK